MARSSANPKVRTLQPKMITIVREEVKIGRNAEHSKHEAGWPAAYEKAKAEYNAQLATAGTDAQSKIESDENQASGCLRILASRRGT